jgi:uncharacterized protein
MNLNDLAHLTAEYGEGWALPHVQRLLKLVERIDAGIAYDHEALAYAVYLHDWGALTRFRRAGVDHALRSRQVAEEEILPHTILTAVQKTLVLDAIEFHDYRCVLPVWTNEAVLLREADFLDFLGTVGFAREMAWSANQMQAAYERIVTRRDALRDRFSIPAAQAIARQRLERLDQILAWLHEEGLGSL